MRISSLRSACAVDQVEDAGALLQEVLQNIRCQPYEETPRGTRLGCQLRLLAALVKVLEPECIGKMSINGGSPSEEGDFVQFLIKGKVVESLTSIICDVAHINYADVIRDVSWSS